MPLFLIMWAENHWHINNKGFYFYVSTSVSSNVTWNLNIILELISN